MICVASCSKTQPFCRKKTPNGKIVNAIGKDFTRRASVHRCRCPSRTATIQGTAAQSEKTHIAERRATPCGCRSHPWFVDRRTVARRWRADSQTRLQWRSWPTQHAHPARPGINPESRPCIAGKHLWRPPVSTMGRHSPRTRRNTQPGRGGKT